MRRKREIEISGFWKISDGSRATLAELTEIRRLPYNGPL